MLMKLVTVFCNPFIHLAGEDYVNDTTNLVFDSGTASVSVSITILNDALHETAESFLASLATKDSDVDLDPDDTIVHILDDDGQCVCVCVWYTDRHISQRRS